MKKWIKLFTFSSLSSLLILTGCYNHCSMCPIPDLTRLIITWACQLDREEFHYLFLEQSSAHTDGCIDGICLRFSSTDLIDLCEARKLIVDVAQGLLCGVNFHPTLFDELCTHPFPVQNLDIVITFESLFGRYVDMRYISQIRLQGGIVTYYAFNAFPCERFTFPDRMFHKHVESFSDAVIISDAYRSVCPPKDLLTPSDYGYGSSASGNGLSNFFHSLDQDQEDEVPRKSIQLPAGSYGPQPGATRRETGYYGNPAENTPPQEGTPPQGYPSQGYAPQGYPAQEYPPQGYAPQGYAPQGLAQPSRGE